MADETEQQSPVGPRYAGYREHFLQDLARIGPRSTPVAINGRTLSLEAALRLIERLPGDPFLARQGRDITVEPDPFAAALPGPSPAVEPGLTRRLIARQDETDARRVTTQVGMLAAWRGEAPAMWQSRR